MSLDVNFSEPDEFNCNELHSCIKSVADIKCIENFTYHVDYLSGKGENYVSNVFRVNLKDATEPDNNISVIVKTLINTTRQELFHELHKREVLAYKYVIDKFKEIQNDLNIENQIILPNCITSSIENGNEVIILEDLLQNGFEIETKIEQIEKLNFARVRFIMSEMAKFHALSFVYKNKEPHKFTEITKDFHDLIFRDGFIGLSKLKKYFIESYEMSLNVIADKNAKDKLEDIKDKLFEILELYTQPKRYNVFCHGDCWINNMLFRHEESKTDMCFVDFQAMRYASPVTDIVYFLYICKDSRFRTEHIEDVKQAYYNSLISFLKLFSLDANLTYPLEEFERDMDDYMPFGLVVALIELRIVTICQNDDATLKELEIEELDSSKVTREESLFATRVNDVVNEAVSNGTLDALCKLMD